VLHQTAFILAKMEEFAQNEGDRWDQKNEYIDLLFAKLGEIDVNKQ
jgi:hypothetical protein